MPWNSRIKLEPRGEKDPKFDPHNKTDRKIMMAIIISVSVLVAIATGLFLLYFLVFKK